MANISPHQRAVLGKLLQADPSLGKFVSQYSAGGLRLLVNGEPAADVQEADLAELRRLGLIEMTHQRHGYVTNDGKAAVVPPRPQQTRWDHILLMPEQEELLSQLVEAYRRVPRDQRRKFGLIESMTSTSLLHPGLPGRPPVHKSDLEILRDKNLLFVTYGSRGMSWYDITPEGFAYYEYMKQRAGQPVQQVEAENRRYLDAEQFKCQYPGAYAKWTDAEKRLWASDSERELTTIGHLCREAMQEFATALVERYNPPDAPHDKAKDVARIRAVLAPQASRMGKTEKAFLDALVAYWGTLSDLVQRQEHGGQREGDPLTWEDARRVVFQTAVVMFEVDRSISWTSSTAA